MDLLLWIVLDPSCPNLVVHIELSRWTEYITLLFLTRALPSTRVCSPFTSAFLQSRLPVFMSVAALSISMKVRPAPWGPCGVLRGSLGSSGVARLCPRLCPLPLPPPLSPRPFAFYTSLVFPQLAPQLHNTCLGVGVPVRVCGGLRAV